MSHALSVLSWMELPEDEQPPESIWLNPELLNDHFESLAAKRKAQASGTETVEDAPMLQNEITKSWRR